VCGFCGNLHCDWCAGYYWIILKHLSSLTLAATDSDFKLEKVIKLHLAKLLQNLPYRSRIYLLESGGSWNAEWVTMLCSMSVVDTTWLIVPNHPVQYWTTKSKIRIFSSFSCPSMILSKEVLKLLLSIAEVNFVCVSFHKLRLKVKVNI